MLPYENGDSSTVVPAAVDPRSIRCGFPSAREDGAWPPLRAKIPHKSIPPAEVRPCPLPSGGAKNHAGGAAPPPPTDAGVVLGAPPAPHLLVILGAHVDLVALDLVCVVLSIAERRFVREIV